MEEQFFSLFQKIAWTIKKKNPRFCSLGKKWVRNFVFSLDYYFTETYYFSFVGFGELLNSPHSSDCIKTIVAIEKVLFSYKYLLIPNNLL